MTPRDNRRGRRGRRPLERDLRARLHAARAPGEDAAGGRALVRVLEAHAAAPVAPRRRVRPALVAAAVAVLIALVAAGLSSPGQAVGDWLRDVVQPKPGQAPPPAASGLPTGRVLAVGGGISVTAQGGRRRWLGGFRDAAFSPHGRFVAATTRSSLQAITPGGIWRWSVVPSARPRMPRWSPDGFRIAYLAGPQLRVVIGDGTDDRLFWGHAKSVAPAFRPGSGHLVAWVDTHNQVRVADVDTAVLAWRAPAPHGVHSLTWSADGHRLLAAGSRSATLYTPGGPTRHIAGRFATAAFPPVAGPPALIERHGGRSSIRLLGSREPLIETSGRYDGLVWSPDGRWLLTRWGDRWLLVRRDGRSVTTVPGRATPVAWVR
jgi:WD40-like Beta Propeller Repeat